MIRSMIKAFMHRPDEKAARTGEGVKDSYGKV